MLRREQDTSAIKQCRKNHEQRAAKAKPKEEPDAVLKPEQGMEASGSDVVNSELDSTKSPVKAEASGGDADVKPTNGSTSNGGDDAEVQVIEKQGKPKAPVDDGGSLWQAVDEPGKKKWRHRLTDEVRRCKTRPSEGKGAILADDVSALLVVLQGRTNVVDGSRQNTFHRVAYGIHS